MKFEIVISSLLSLFTMKGNSLVHKIFCEPQASNYSLSEDLKINDENLNWISHHEDSKNLSKDLKNLKKDMVVALEDYKSKANG